MNTRTRARCRCVALARRARRRRPRAASTACPTSNPPNDARARGRHAAERPARHAVRRASFRSRSRTRTAARSRRRSPASPSPSPRRRRGRAASSRQRHRTRRSSAPTRRDGRPRRRSPPTRSPAATRSSRRLRLRLGRRSRSSNTPSGVPADDRGAVAVERSRRSSEPATAKPLRREVLDANGNPVTGANVTFSLGAGRHVRRRRRDRPSDVDRRDRPRDLAAASSPARLPERSPRPPTVRGRRVGTVRARQPRGEPPHDLDRRCADAVGGGRHSLPTAARGARSLDADGRRSRARPSPSRSARARRRRHGRPPERASPAARPGDRDHERATGSPSSPRLVANTTAGTFTATATVTGGRTVVFTLRNLAGAATRRSPPAPRRASRRPSERASRSGSPSPSPTRTATRSPGVIVTFSAPTRRCERTLRRHGTTHRAREDRTHRGIAVAPAFVADANAGRLRRARDRRRARSGLRARQRACRRMSEPAALEPHRLALADLAAGRERRPAHAARCARRSRRSGSRSASPRSSPCSASRRRRRPGCSARSTSSARTCSPSQTARRCSAARPSCRSPRRG